MPSKRCLVIADHAEIAATLSHFNGDLSGTIGDFIITGWGGENVRNTLAPHLAHYDTFWNIGFAGALDSALPLFSMHQIREIGAENSPSLTLSAQGKRLYSAEAPIHNRDIQPSGWDLVDMEGYALAELCLHLGKKCYMWKIVSDFASQGGEVLIQKHKEALSSCICEFLIHESSHHP